MRGLLKVLWKFLKWSVIVILTLVALVTLIVNLPPVQKYILNKGTNFFNEKTGGELTIDGLDLRLPYYIQLNGIQLKTPNNELLAAIKNIEVSIGWRYLFDRTIRIDKFVIDELEADINQNRGSDWNYQFIMDGFADTTAAKAPVSEGEPWDFSVGYVALSDIDARYYSFESGDSVQTLLDQFRLSMNRFSTLESVYLAEKIRLSGSQAFIRLADSDSGSDPGTSTAKADTSALPLTVGLDKLTLENNTVHFETAGSPDHYFIDLGSLTADVEKLDLEKQFFRLNKINLENSNFELAMSPSMPDTNTAPLDPFLPLDLILNTLNISNVSIHMSTIGEPENDLNLKDIVLKLRNVEANPELYALEVKKFKGIYNQLDRLESLEAKMRITPHEAEMEKLLLKYGHSVLDAALYLSYASLDDLVDKGNFAQGKVAVNKLLIAPRDVAQMAYAFEVPDSIMIVPSQAVSFQMRAEGSLEKLAVDMFDLKTGNSTFSAVASYSSPSENLEDWLSKNYTLSNLAIHVEQKDVWPYVEAFGLDSSFIPRYADLDLSGYFRSDTSELKGDLRSGFGNISLGLDGGGWKTEELPLNFDISSETFDAGSLLGLAEELRFDFEIDGRLENVLDSVFKATALINLDTLIYDRYELHGLDLSAVLDSNVYAYNLSIKDSFLLAEISGKGAFYTNMEVSLDADIEGIDFQALGIVEDDMRARMKLRANYYQYDSIQTGEFHLSDAIFIKEEERYNFEPIDATVYLSADSAYTSVKSQFFDMESVSNRNVEQISIAVADLLGRKSDALEDSLAYWRADFRSKDLSLISELFLPDLTKFEPSYAAIDFNAQKSEIDATMDFPEIVYGAFRIDSLNMKAIGNVDSVLFNVDIKRVGMDSLALKNVNFDGHRTDRGAQIELLVKDDWDTTRYYIGANLLADSISLKSGFGISLIDSLILNKETWNVDESNDIHYTDNGIKLSHLRIFDGQSELAFSKEPNENSVDIFSKDFELSTLTGLVQTEEPLLNGSLSGELRLNTNGTFDGSGGISKFRVAGADFGQLNWEAAKDEGGYKINLDTQGDAIAFSLGGSLIPLDSSDSKIDMVFDLDRLNMDALPKLVPESFFAGGGSLTGQVDIEGSLSEILLSGAFDFNKASVGMVANGAMYYIDQQSIDIKPNRISLSSFTVTDSSNQKLVINGAINHENFENIRTDLVVRSEEFTLANLKRSDGQNMYGKLLAALDIQVKGKVDAPEIDATVDISEKTNLSYLVPESEYSEDIDEGLLRWTDFDSDPADDILLRNKREETMAKKDVFANTIDLNGNLNINENAKFRVVIDTIAGDYLEIQGGGKLGIAYDRAGNLRLNGTYKVKDGFYQLTLYNIVKKRFQFQSGSQLTWNGDPTDAQLDITALYQTKANVATLMASDATSSSNEAFQQKLPFEVVMNITGQLSKPEIAFGIRLQQEARGALGGAVDARLAELKNNESELNKQVFSLLVLNTFMGPSSGDQNIVANQARNSASQVLSQQLNALSDRFIAGVDLNFDLESYGGDAGQGNTDLNIDLQKSFANDRVIVKVGSSIALEDNSNASQNSKEMMTNIALEYKITEDGRYRFKAFRKTDLEDIVVGRITRTGGGLLFQKDFDRFKNLLKPVQTASDSLNLDFAEPDSTHSEP